MGMTRNRLSVVAGLTVFAGGLIKTDSSDETYTHPLSHRSLNHRFRPVTVFRVVQSLTALSVDHRY